MLRVCVVSSPSGTTLTLYGALVGSKVEELERCWQMLRVIRGDRPICVQLKQPLRIGHRGEELLATMRLDGVVVIERDREALVVQPGAGVRRFSAR